MKKAFVLYFLVVVLGVITSMSASEKIIERVFDLYSGTVKLQMDYTLVLESYLISLEAYEAQDSEEFYKNSCASIQLYLDFLELYDGNIEGLQKIESQALLARAKETISRLETAELCGF
ncbi:hypothetical protein [Pseudoalteromonas umbrosa]|uniref:hypothetical protein n=1 Tax=Pseudoalteromonas umbrosa TaxID=3048489 RepID=UPI0024C3889E|nr:hypothetical protein [Pseudoalteromonas sp. B95]MDK1286266.1 hypothetical protein [Pseudoalteromonas sp. B95]